VEGKRTAIQGAWPLRVGTGKEERESGGKGEKGQEMRDRGSWNRAADGLRPALMTAH